MKEVPQFLCGLSAVEQHPTLSILLRTFTADVSAFRTFRMPCLTHPPFTVFTCKTIKWEIYYCSNNKFFIATIIMSNWEITFLRCLKRVWFAPKLSKEKKRCDGLCSSICEILLIPFPNHIPACILAYKFRPEPFWCDSDELIHK